MVFNRGWGAARLVTRPAESVVTQGLLAVPDPPVTRRLAQVSRVIAASPAPSSPARRAGLADCTRSVAGVPAARLREECRELASSACALLAGELADLGRP